jgi:FkbM family methyltransferase
MGAEHPAFAIPKSLAGEIVWMHPRFLTSNFHSMEPHVFAWIGKYVRAGSVALDIGANFGMMSLYMGRITGPTGRVFAFEPSPANGAVLRFHCEHNPRLNIQPVDVAVSNQDNSSVSFFLMEGGLHSGNSLTFDRDYVPNLDPVLHAAQKEIQVETITIDGFCKTHDLTPDLIKIDVEGAEILVLEGAQQTLLNRHPAVILAVHPWWLPEGRTVNEIQDLLRAVGYSIIRPDGETAHQLEYAEYLCVPSSQPS